MLSKKAAAIPPSATLLINAMATEFRKQGFRVINFSAGQPDMTTPKNICQAAKKAINEGFTRYTPTAGIPELKQAIIEKLKRDNGLSYNPSQIICSAGGKQALMNVIFALVDEDEEVILPIPAWLSYPKMINVCGGKTVLVKTNQDFKITQEQLEKAITKKTKLLILNSPANPTGATYTEEELKSLGKIIAKYDIWAISDEVYETQIYDGQKHVSIASLNSKLYEKTIVVNAVSKTYAMTGWRLGYAAGNEKVIGAAGSFQSHTTSCPSSISQRAALEALTGPQDFIKKMQQEYDKRRKLMVAGLQKTPGLKVAMPQGAFYVFVDISRVEKSSEKFCRNLLEKEKVAAIPGAVFMAEGYIRLSYATSREDIKEGLKRINKFVKENHHG